MPRLAPPPLKLSETEREQLQQLVNRHSTPQQSALRASIILLASGGRESSSHRPAVEHQPRHGQVLAESLVSIGRKRNTRD